MFRQAVLTAIDEADKGTGDRVRAVVYQLGKDNAARQ